MHRPVRTAVPLLLLTTMFMSCTGSTAEPPLEVTAPLDQVDPVLSPVRMSAAWLSELDLEAGQIVLVPSDDAILSLDADALANLATTGVAGHVVEPGTVWAPDQLVAGEEADLVSVDGQRLPVRSDDSGITIDDVGVQQAIEWNDITILIMDGVVDR